MECSGGGEMGRELRQGTKRLVAAVSLAMGRHLIAPGGPGRDLRVPERAPLR